jgi:hypothetical protein
MTLLLAYLLIGSLIAHWGNHSPMTYVCWKDTIIVMMFWPVLVAVCAVLGTIKALRILITGKG